MNCELFSLYVFVHFQHVLLVRILIFHLIHRFLDHEDAQAADGPFLRGEGNVRVFLGQGIVGDSAVDEGDHHGPGLFLQVHADGDGAGVRGVGIAGDVDKNLFHGHVDLHQDLHGAAHGREILVHEIQHLLEIRHFGFKGQLFHAHSPFSLRNMQ